VHFGEPLPVINVSQVRKLGPFRYPGGKTWFFPYFAAWLRWMLPRRPDLEPHLVEPFAGGASVGLNALAEGLVERLTLVEIDLGVATFWKVVFSEESPLLIEKILRFEPTLENAERALSEEGGDEVDLAFRVLLRNRIAYGGILAKGAGRMRRGEDGRGPFSRWYPETLARRIEALHGLRSRVEVVHGDGVRFLAESAQRPLVFFVDPPYTAGGGPGGRLYRYAEVDHGTLLRLLARLKGEFLATYNDAEEVVRLAEEAGLDHLRVPMLARKGKVVKELVLCRDASWAAEIVSPTAPSPKGR